MAPSLTLHHLHISQSERIVWLLEELNVPYNLKLHTRDPVFSPPELEKLTPMGSAPVLTSTTPAGHEFTITETMAIVEYILTVSASASARKELSISPDDEDYAQYLFWLHWANGSFQPSIMRQLTARRMDPKGENPVSQSVAQRLEKHLKALNERLSETGAWLAGSKFTVAEIVTVWCVTTMRQFCPFDLTPYPATLAWLEMVANREGYVRAMEKCEEDYDWKKGMTGEGPGNFVPRT